MLHNPHLGIEKILYRARLEYFWPCKSNDLTELVNSCKVCEKFTPNNQNEPLIQEKPEQYPFQRILTDIYKYAGLNSTSYTCS